MADSLLACPRCDNALRNEAETNTCPACRIEFPLLDGIPFLFAEPRATLGEWRARWHAETQRLAHEAANYAAALEGERLPAASRDRLERLKEACTDQAQRLKTLMTPLGGDGPAAHETYLALRTRLPASQGLNTYYANIHRDWCWGDDENAASADIVASALDASPGTLLVLGAGGARLAYDLHRRRSPEQTIALDFNPLLMLLAHRIVRGETVDLWEFPLAPKRIEDHAALRPLSAPEPVDDRFRLVIADALRAPLLPGSIDTIVTPWISDILPEDFAVWCARINALLTDGGQWINFGSLTFDRPDPAQQYSREEAESLIEANGFSRPTVREDWLPYMCSPASRHGRRELVVTLASKKTSSVKRPERSIALPDWLVKGADPVPVLPAFQAQTVSMRIHAFVMSLIDGKRSIADMAALFEEQRLMSRQEAEPVIREFLIKMLDH